MHTIKFHYLPQQDGRVPKACGEWLLALVTPDLAQELSGRLLVDSWKSVLSVDPCFILQYRCSWCHWGKKHTPALACVSSVPSVPCRYSQRQAGDNVMDAPLVVKSIYGLFFSTALFLKLSQKVMLGSGEKLTLILHQKQRCSVFL